MKKLILRRDSGTVLIKRLKLLFVFGIIFLATLFACKKEQPEFNKAPQDPCACASEVSADFVIEEIALWNTSDMWYSETDSILRNQRVRFTALEENAEYKWYIGLDELTDQSVVRYFQSQWAGSIIPITLVVKKDPNTICFPDDDGYDSIIKVFTVSEFGKIDPDDPNNLIYGTKEGLFRMKEKNSLDSIEIGIDYVVTNQPYINFYNYDGEGGNCIETAQVNLGITYRESRIGDNGGQICNRLRAVIITTSVNNVEMYFTEYEPGHPDYKEYHYKGRRLGAL